ncbi:hypothetical protein NG798_00545 [Ancylothrix sp. C2]|uniref:hypothetical protein n=1 Tax=Ancylothrix sp. D3o TaxID=2953691 RepID=UPI0021BB96EF|nr:hypothetical protein [Ancylothrix sp. D3o]MCT7948281.1 hypothetical protein [Ancylothrix sp. D3o]
MKNELLFESRLDDLLKQFVQNQAKLIKEGDFEDGYYEASDIDFEPEFCNWINQKVAEFAQAVEWDTVQEQVSEATK